MKTFLTCIVLLATCGCGLLHRGEIEAPRLHSSSPKVSCSFPDLKKFEKVKNLKESDLRQIADCLELNADRAFGKIKGSSQRELSYKEIRTLAREGIVDLGIEKEIYWTLIENGLPIFHPQGKSAIHKEFVSQFIGWFRKYIPTLIRMAHTEGRTTDENEWLVGETVFSLVEELSALLSSEWRLSFESASQLLRAAYEFESERLGSSAARRMRPITELTDNLEALWILKSLGLPDNRGQGVRSEINGKDVKELIQLGLGVLRDTPDTIHWFWQGGAPAAVPNGLTDEASKIASRLAIHFEKHAYIAIDSERLAWALRRLDPRSPLYQLSAEVVRLSQRLTPAPKREAGLHISSVVALLDLLPKIAEDWKRAGKQFTAESGNSGRLSIRRAQASSLLSRIALKGPLYRRSSFGSPLKKRLDYELKWDDILGRLALRQFMHRLFLTFDPENKHQGKMPLKGIYDEDLRETLDLAYTFLRFASMNQQKKPGAGPQEEALPQPVIVKPGALYRAMGLLGDRWMLDGDNDDALNAEEFFSVTQLYDEITAIANTLSWSSARAYYPKNVSSINRNYMDRLYGRREYIESLPKRYEYELPVLNQALKLIGGITHSSLYHSLIGNPQQKPMEVFPDWFGGSGAVPQARTILHYVSHDSALPVAAIMVLLDRSFIRCDQDENNQFSWKELNCVTPLLLNAGLEVIKSGLIELDPEVSFGSRVTLEFLQMKGLPQAVAKVLLVNGTIDSFELEAQFPAIKSWAESKLAATFDDLARFIGAPKNATPSQRRVWLYEARKRFGDCDQAPKDNFLRGKAELNCFTKRVLEQTIDALSQITSTSPEIVSGILSLEKFALLGLAVPIATQEENVLNQIFENEIPLSSDAPKILGLLENLIRRAPENALQVYDFAEGVR